MKATELLKKQHREVKALFGQAKKAPPPERRRVLDEITHKLRAHMSIEESIFYPAVREIGTKKTDEIVPEAYEEHHVVSLVLDELPNVDVHDERFEAKVTVLDELIAHHVDEEEHEMFKVAEKLGADRLAALGTEMAAATNGESAAPRKAKAPKKVAAAALVVALGAWSGTPTWAADPATTGEAAKSAPDDTGRNVRDRGDTVTSGDQSETTADRTTTQKIRQAVVADDSLSTNGHNVKIITVNGVVTLRGPVKDEAERKTIGAMAVQVAGADKVQNHLDVASTQ